VQVYRSHRWKPPSEPRVAPRAFRFLLACLWLCLAALTGGRADAAAPRTGKAKDASSDATLRDGAAESPAADAAGTSQSEVEASDADDEAAVANDAAADSPPPPATPPPSPGGSAAAGPAPSGSALPPVDLSGGAPVRIHDRKVFFIHVARGGQTPVQRAANASQALEHAVEDTDARGVRVDENGDVAIVFLGDSPIIQLGPDDAAAEGDATVGVNAAAVASKIQSAVAKERKRSALATTFFSISLLVFSALIVFLALGRLGSLVSRTRVWIEKNPDRLPNVRIAGIDVIRPAALRGGVLVAIDASKWVLRLGVAYAWILFALSLFESTRVYSERLTGFVFAPLSGLMGRAASALPVVIVLAVAGLAVALLVRFVALFFGSVSRAETTLPWLPSDLAQPTSVLVRVGIVLVAVTFAAPLVTGSEEGSLARAGAIALIAIALSVTPMLATAALGAVVVFGRRLHVGDHAEVGGRSGVVRAVSLLEVSLEDSNGCEIRVPHLASLLHPTRLLGGHPPIVVEIVVSAGHSQPKVRDILETEAKRITERFSVSLDWIDAGGAGYTVVVFSADLAMRSVLLVALSEALNAQGIPLGYKRQPAPGGGAAP
jgi:small-conductance mechanosensitive channel